MPRRRGITRLRVKEASLPRDDANPPPADRAWAYFLDIDGTLVDIAASPSAVRVSAETPKLLARLRDVTGGAVALVTGRALADVDRLFPGLSLPGAGQHGVERRDAAGVVEVAADRGSRQERAFIRLTRLVETYRALELEEKGQSFALHYRAAPHLEERVRQVARAVQAELGPRYVVREGKCVAEVGPSNADKGRAIEAFLEAPPFRGRLPVFVGDDLTDEDGFAVVNARGGHSVKVGQGPSSARWRLPDTAAVVRWLEGAVKEEVVRSA
jgi:trehalose 6-phosphate phosphatase